MVRVHRRDGADGARDDVRLVAVTGGEKRMGLTFAHSAGSADAALDVRCLSSRSESGDRTLTRPLLTSSETKSSTAERAAPAAAPRLPGRKGREEE
jgi:hypothetical protein